MEKISIAIETNISLSVLDLALRSVLDGSATPAYFMELARSGCFGKNRAKKSVTLLNRLTTRNKLLPYIEKDRDSIDVMLRSKFDRPLLMAAIMSSAYSIFYDTIAILGKHFHAQDEVGRTLLLKKLCEKYGSNRALFKAYNCVIPMLIDADFIHRDKPGVYTKVRQEKYSDKAAVLYRQAFLLNNPTLNGRDKLDSYPFFEFIR